MGWQGPLGVRCYYAVCCFGISISCGLLVLHDIRRYRVSAISLSPLRRLLLHLRACIEKRFYKLEIYGCVVSVMDLRPRPR